CVRRSKFLPFGGSLEQSAIDALAEEIKQAHGKVYLCQKQFTLDAEARELWAREYHDLSEGKPGLLGAITGRAEAQTIRLGLLYAVLDRTDKIIKAVHLRAALALWQYCADSAAYVWGDSLGDPFTDSLLQALRNSGGMSRIQIRDHFQRNQSREKIDTALATL